VLRNILFTSLVPGARCAVSVDILAEVLGAAASYGVQTLHANLRHLRSPLICRDHEPSFGGRAAGSA
jgi:hypothetical protein